MKRLIHAAFLLAGIATLIYTIGAPHISTG